MKDTNANLGMLEKEEVQGLVDKYFAYLRSHTTIREARGEEAKEWTMEIVAPFHNRKGERIRLYLRRDENFPGEFILSDARRTMRNLTKSGREIRRGALADILNSCGGVCMDYIKLHWRTRGKDFGTAMHCLLQTMQRIDAESHKKVCPKCNGVGRVFGNKDGEAFTNECKSCGGYQPEPGE